MELTEEQKAYNYNCLVASINSLKKGELTDEWRQNHHIYFNNIREIYPNFRNVELDVDTYDTAMLLDEIEVCAETTEFQIRMGEMDYKIYLEFLEKVFKIFTVENQHKQDDDEMSSLINMLKV